VEARTEQGRVQSAILDRLQKLVFGGLKAWRREALAKRFERSMFILGCGHGMCSLFVL
jgi:hypothetical protein